MFSIGELSKRVGVKIPTIRYYEQRGLIEPSSRSDGNQRRYSARGLERLSFIKHTRELGLSMHAIGESVELSAHLEQPCADIDRYSRDQLQAARSKIKRLKRLEVELRRISLQRKAGNQVDDCYVIRALADHSLCDSEH